MNAARVIFPSAPLLFVPKTLPGISKRNKENSSHTSVEATGEGRETTEENERMDSMVIIALAYNRKKHQFHFNHASTLARSLKSPTHSAKLADFNFSSLQHCQKKRRLCT
jgi:hypothetical protein